MINFENEKKLQKLKPKISGKKKTLANLIVYFLNKHYLSKVTYQELMIQ